MNHRLHRELDRYQAETSLRVLVAENDGPLLRLLSRLLHSDGHEVVAVRDCAELLDELAATLMDRASAFDVIVCAHRLPGMSGLSILAGLRSRDPSTGFVLVTEDSDIQRRARAMGAATLAAPFGRLALQAAVQRSLDRQPANDNGADHGARNHGATNNGAKSHGAKNNGAANRGDWH